MARVSGFAEEPAPAGAKAGDAVAVVAAAARGSASAEPLLVAPSPFRACAEPGDRRRRRRLAPPAGRSGAGTVGETAGASTATTALDSAGLFAPSPVAGRRRRL